MKAEFIIDDPLVQVEERKQERSSVKVEKWGKRRIITVTARDAVALMAASNSVLKQIVMAEKSRKLSDTFKNKH
ncbi:MAG: hypothetical protein KJ709_04225 [Nanoarchaeota archaeon]|nr:hypothetical protein [Nanoarchaeota archaeon]